MAGSRGQLIDTALASLSAPEAAAGWRCASRTSEYQRAASVMPGRNARDMLVTCRFAASSPSRADVGRLCATPEYTRNTRRDGRLRRLALPAQRRTRAPRYRSSGSGRPSGHRGDLRNGRIPEHPAVRRPGNLQLRRAPRSAVRTRWAVLPVSAPWHEPTGNARRVPAGRRARPANRGAGWRRHRFRGFHRRFEGHRPATHTRAQPSAFRVASARARGPRREPGPHPGGTSVPGPWASWTCRELTLRRRQRRRRRAGLSPSPDPGPGPAR